MYDESLGEYVKIAQSSLDGLGRVFLDEIGNVYVERHGISRRWSKNLLDDVRTPTVRDAIRNALELIGWRLIPVGEYYRANHLYVPPANITEAKRCLALGRSRPIIGFASDDIRGGDLLSAAYNSAMARNADGKKTKALRRLIAGLNDGVIRPALFNEFAERIRQASDEEIKEIDNAVTMAVESSGNLAALAMYAPDKYVRRIGNIGSPLPPPFFSLETHRIQFRRGATSMIAGTPGSCKTVLALKRLPNRGANGEVTTARADDRTAAYGRLRAVQTAKREGTPPQLRERSLYDATSRPTP